MGWLEGRFEDSFLVTTLEQGINWARESSMWPMTFGLACCAIEMMAAGASRYDIDRFGAGAFRATPRQADLMIVAGTVNYKMASRVRRLYNQMPDPKFVIAMGACTCGGGPYYKYGYNVVKGVDLVVPVDVYVPGCPPRPEALLEGLMRIQDKVRGMRGLTKNQPIDLPIPSRFPATSCCPPNSATPTRSRRWKNNSRSPSSPRKRPRPTSGPDTSKVLSHILLGPLFNHFEVATEIIAVSWKPSSAAASRTRKLTPSIPT